MSVSFEPKGSRATHAFQVDNPSEESIAVEVYIIPREMGEDGQESFNKPARSTKKEDESDPVQKQFLVYPPQLILKPHEKRTIRVSWVGDPNPSHELAFRLVAEQLPVTFESNKQKQLKAVINMLMKYVAAIYITPSGVKPEIIIKEAALVKGKKDQLKIVFENKGTEHKLLNGLVFKIKSLSSDSEVFLPTQEEIKEIIGQNILAGKTRTFLIPWPKPLPKAPVRVDFELKE